MKNRFGVLLLVCSILLGSVNIAYAATPSEIPSSQLITDGFIIDDFDLTKSGAVARSGSDAGLLYTNLSGDTDCYQIKANPSYPTYTQVESRKIFQAKGNRTYKLSMLVNTNLTQQNCEVSVGFAFRNEEGQKLCHRTTGLPVTTSGEWVRFEYEFTAPGVKECDAAFYALYSDRAYSEDSGYDYTERNACYVSDLRVIEMEPKTLTPLSPGEGMTFGGSSGGLGMKIEDVSVNANLITVRTGGASFQFDKSTNTITGTQLINQKRKVVTLSLNKPLARLAVFSQSENEVILTTGENGASFGVQMDGMMFISNHGSMDLITTCTSNINGEWNRLAYGHLIALDKIGGFTVNPSIPDGTGVVPRYQTVGTLDFAGKYRDVEFLSSEEKGWQVKWTTSTGELLGVSVFPPRELRVGDISSKRSVSIDGYVSADSNITATKDKYGITTVNFWNAIQRGYGMSNSGTATPVNETNYAKAVDAVNDAGQVPILYLSFYFWHNRDVDEYINEVKRHRDTYGINGVYSDGLPGMDWLKSYECMRRLRELFPTGEIHLHATGISENGGPPLSCPDLFIPAIDTYADACVRGEDIDAVGLDWVYPEYCCNGKNTNGTLNYTKGNKWYASEADKANRTAISTLENSMLNIVNNGQVRIRHYPNNASIMYEEEISLLDSLEKYRAIAGFTVTEADENYYSLARRLARKNITNIDTEKNIFNVDFGNITNEWEMFSNKESSVTSGSNGLSLKNGLSGLAKAEYSFENENGIVNIALGIKTSGSCPFFITVGNGQLNGVSLMTYAGKLYAAKYGGGLREVAELSLDTVHNLEIETDAASKMYSLILDGDVVADNLPYEANDLYTLNRVTFKGTYGEVGELIINKMEAHSKF